MSDRSNARPSSARNWLPFLPALVVIVLNLPSLLLGYFWDDFYFLTFKGTGDVWANLLPDAASPFYRPIPLGLYFKLLRFVDPTSGVLGHLMNLAALVGVVLLLGALVTRLAGARAGLFAGLLFAFYGQVPGLVAWVSGSQDLFALLFVTAAFLLRHQGRNVAALLCATAALLCKEPALAAFPVLVFWDRLVGREAQRPRFTLASYAAVALAWALVHPGLHLLAGSGFKSGAANYVGLEHPERWGLYVVRYLVTLVNLPAPGMNAAWWGERAVVGFAALVLALIGLAVRDYPRKGGKPAASVPLERIARLSALFVVPSLLLPALLVRHWTPYFACLPALGAAIFLGPLLAARGRATALSLLALFALLGVWSRGSRTEREWVLSESAMADASNAMRAVRANLTRLHPAFPKGSQLVVSFGTRGIRGVQSAIAEGQAPSLWYGDPSLRAVALAERTPPAGREFFVRVTNGLDVIAFDLDPFDIRSTLAAAPDLSEIDQPLSRYAREVAAGGETDRAIRIVEGLNRIESGDLIQYNRRMIASILLAAGRRPGADSLLASTAPFPREVAIDLVVRIQAEATSNEALDLAAFEAFGLSASDPATLRAVMQKMQRVGTLGQAAWWAERLGRLAPGDTGAAEVLRAAAAKGIPPRREPPRRVASPHANGA